MKLLILALLASQCFGAWGYYILHTPATSQVSGGPHTDFPVLIDTTHDDLRVTGSGGLVTDAQGGDIAPYADSSCSTLLPFELVAYDGTTGRFRAHVSVASLSGSSAVYLCFQNASQTTSLANASGTWNSGFVAVYHLGDGSTCGVNDSTSNGLTMTNTGTVNAATGKIYGACGTNWATTRYLERAHASVWNITSITVSAWAKAAAFSDYRNIISKVNSDASLRAFEMDAEVTTGKLRGIVTVGGALKVATSSSAVSTSAFQHLAMAADTTDVQTYINGAADGSAASTGGTLDTNSAAVTIGALYTSAGFVPWDDIIDEVRVSNVRRSSDWIATEYNSGTPSTFWTVGSPMLVGGARRRMVIVQ